MPPASSSKTQSGKAMLEMLKTGPKNMARDKAQAERVDKIVQGTKVQDKERALAESFAPEMGSGDHMEDTTGMKRAFTGANKGTGEFQSMRVPAPDERTSAAAQVPRPLLRDLLQGKADPNRFPSEQKPRHSWSGDMLYASINLEGLAANTKLLRAIHQRSELALERLSFQLKRYVQGDLEAIDEEGLLEELAFIDRVLGA